MSSRPWIVELRVRRRWRRRRLGRWAGPALWLVVLVLPACGGSTPAEAGPSAGADGAQVAPAAQVAGAEAAIPIPASAVWFEDQAAESGLLFVHQSGHDEAYLMPEIMGGGAALLDADGDGRLDIYCVQSGGVLAAPADRPGNQLFFNRSGSEALRFEDGTEGSGADDRGYGMGVTAADLDNDGFVDLYVTNWGANALLLNDGTGRFRDVTAASGAGHEGWGASAAAVDVDADGWLDLFVVNYIDWSPAGELTCHNDLGLRDWCNPANYQSPARDALLANRGPDGAGVLRFEDRSEASGVASVPGTGLGLGCGDFDDDGHVDVFVANDGMPDALWKGDGTGGFQDVALLAGCAVDASGRSKAGMGVALADVDDDGDLDLMVCNLDRQSDSFFLNHGGWFDDVTIRAGLARHSQPFTRFGMGLVDFDRDGWLDLFQANGRVAHQAEVYGQDPLGEPDLLLPGASPVRQQDGSLAPRFVRAASADGTALPPALTGRAAAFGDLDDDGAVDVVVINKDGPARLLHNVTARSRPASERHWLGLVVLDGHGSAGLGARVTVAAGNRTLTRDVRAAFSYLASNDPRLHLGLGAQDTVGIIEVLWPDGYREAFGPVPVDAWHTLQRGEGHPVR